MAFPRQTATSRRNPRSPRYWMIAVIIFVVVAVGFAPTLAQSPSQSADSTPGVKPDAKKAKAAYQEGIRAEKQQDWDAAYSAYSDAANSDPKHRDYALRREIA